MDIKTESLIESGDSVYPSSISAIAEKSDALFYFIFWISLVLLIGLTCATGYFIWTHLKGKNQPKKPHMIHNVALDLLWTIIPTILCFIVFYCVLFNMVSQKKSTVLILNGYWIVFCCLVTIPIFLFPEITQMAKNYKYLYGLNQSQANTMWLTIFFSIIIFVVLD